MKKKSYIKERGFVLRELYKLYENHVEKVRLANDYGNQYQTSKGQITELLKNEYKTEIWEADLILISLKEEGFIESIEPLKISLKGITFMKYGGFKSRILIKTISVIGSVLIFFFTAAGFFKDCSKTEGKSLLPPKANSTLIKCCGNHQCACHQQKKKIQLNSIQNR